MLVAGLAGDPDPQLATALGATGAHALAVALAARARRWAAAAAPGRVYEATSVAAAAAALHDHAGPVLVAAGDVPALAVERANEALGDLADGCDVSVGVTHEARPYLVALPSLDVELLELAREGFAIGLLASAAERGLTIGMLRHERRLASIADAVAFARDPLTDPELRALLRAV